jgi:hypothetical protein
MTVMLVVIGTNCTCSCKSNRPRRPSRISGNSDYKDSRNTFHLLFLSFFTFLFKSTLKLILWLGYQFQQHWVIFISRGNRILSRESAYHHLSCEFELRSWQHILQTTLCDKVCQWLAVGRWLSPGTPVSSTNKTDHPEVINFNNIGWFLSVEEIGFYPEKPTNLSEVHHIKFYYWVIHSNGRECMIAYVDIHM